VAVPRVRPKAGEKGRYWIAMTLRHRSKRCGTPPLRRSKPSRRTRAPRSLRLPRPFPGGKQGTAHALRPKLHRWREWAVLAWLCAALHYRPPGPTGRGHDSAEPNIPALQCPARGAGHQLCKCCRWLRCPGSGRRPANRHQRDSRTGTCSCLLSQAGHRNVTCRCLPRSHYAWQRDWHWHRQLQTPQVGT
jgi:hypothetical protein